jgi:hypothetical protein
VRTLSVALAAFLIGTASTLLVLNRMNSLPPVLAQGGDAPLGNPAIPVVPGLLEITHNHETMVGTSPILLDGLQAENSIYAGSPTMLVYGGGAYRLNHLVFGSPMNLQLVGAAANTVHLLELLGFLRDAPEPPKTQPATEKGKPFVRHIRETKIEGEFASPYDGK